ncbi:MAG TPA: hypothetical protein VMU15_06195 [Anaeromyxobacter sp.]|nr:hypothetical protein [Anaeromyxobacter sp.]
MGGFMTTRRTVLSGFAAGALLLAACFPPNQVVSRKDSFAQIDPGQRDAVFARALQVLLSRGWIMAAVDREAGLLATQPRETYVQEWADYQRDTLQVSISTDGQVAVSLVRQLRPAMKDAQFGPDPSRAAATAAAEQDAILSEITSAVDVSVLNQCRDLATEYASALRYARTCGRIGEYVCSESRPTIDEGSQVLNKAKTSVVPSRTTDLDRILSEYRQAGCAFADKGTQPATPEYLCLGASGSALCQ